MRQAVAVVIGAGVFASAYFAVGLSFWFSSGAAALGYVAGFLIGSRGAASREKAPVGSVDLKKLLDDADMKIRSIAAFAEKIDALDSRRRLERICDCARGIVADIRKDPKDAPRARRFLNYYLDAVTRIIGHYTELTGRGIRSAEAKTALAKVETLFETVETAFEKQRAALARDDVLDLDAEIDLLRKTLSMEGMDHEK